MKNLKKLFIILPAIFSLLFMQSTMPKGIFDESSYDINVNPVRLARKGAQGAWNHKELIVAGATGGIITGAPLVGSIYLYNWYWWQCHYRKLVEDHIKAKRPNYPAAIQNARRCKTLLGKSHSRLLQAIADLQNNLTSLDMVERAIHSWI